jgi:hypothetical protein
VCERERDNERVRDKEIVRDKERDKEREREIKREIEIKVNHAALYFSLPPIPHPPPAPPLSLWMYKKTPTTSVEGHTWWRHSS